MMRSVDIMLSKPGVYVIVSPHGTGLVEVDDQGRCYQLRLEAGHGRDGELMPGRWLVGNIQGILGPFARVPG